MGSRTVRGRSRFEGMVAVVTGATRGIGAATTQGLVDEGGRVCMVARGKHDGERWASKLGPAAFFVQGDVRDPETADRVVAQTLARFGAVDVLVNNAAMDFSGPTVLETTYKQAQEVIDTNFLGVFTMLAACARAMRNETGSIVNVASRAGIVGVHGMGVYGAAKAAVLSLTRTAAVELADRGIRVNAVAPGLTDTPLVAEWVAQQSNPEEFRANLETAVPLGRFAAPAEVAHAILFLASTDASHITGTALPVDGGYTAV